MTEREMTNLYFDWLCSFTIDTNKKPINTYRKLLVLLHDIDFIPIVPHDENRAQDGVDLRLRFSRRYKCTYDIDAECSVLEMMIALALRCEEQIMDDPDIGNRTASWFWLMVRNLGLATYTDNRFDPDLKRRAEDKISKFIDRKYDSTGQGGLFVIENCKYDLRDVEIWYQMCWYLDGLI